MKKTSIAAAALWVAASSAVAQTNVTISGFLDVGVGKSIGTNDKAVQEGAVGNSRLTFRGSEDLGDGYFGVFNFEHRFRPDTGAEGVTGRFWQGISAVGIRTPYGTVNLGRQYVAAFHLLQSAVDPFAGQTVANLRDVGMRPGASVLGVSGSPAGVAAVGKTRVSDSIRYDYNGSGFNFAATVAEKTQEGGATTGPNRPVSFGTNYAMGPLWVAVSYENPQYDNDVLWNLGARYTWGPATLMGGLANGRTATDLKLRGGLIAVNYVLGSADVKAGYAFSKVGNVELKRLAVGYHYNLSKRTKIYADIAHESEIARFKTGADLGLFVTF